MHSKVFSNDPKPLFYMAFYYFITNITVNNVNNSNWV